jgi:hypothetical protein
MTMPTRPRTMFLLCFGVVAISGALIVEVGHALGDFDHFYFAGIQTLYVGAAAFLIEAVVLGVVAAWRQSLAETLAGYAGVVLGTVPVNALAHYDLATVCRWGKCPPAPDTWGLLANALAGLIIVAPVAGAIFLVIGLVRLRRRGGRPTPGAAAA